MLVFSFSLRCIQRLLDWPTTGKQNKMEINTVAVAALAASAATIVWTQMHLAKQQHHIDEEAREEKYSKGYHRPTYFASPDHNMRTNARGMIESIELDEEYTAGRTSSIGGGAPGSHGINRPRWKVYWKDGGLTYIHNIDAIDE